VPSSNADELGNNEEQMWSENAAIVDDMHRFPRKGVHSDSSQGWTQLLQFYGNNLRHPCTMYLLPVMPCQEVPL